MKFHLWGRPLWPFSPSWSLRMCSRSKVKSARWLCCSSTQSLTLPAWPWTSSTSWQPRYMYDRARKPNAAWNDVHVFHPFLWCYSQDNAIYNLLPDIISRLSDPERGMTTEDFNTIMKWVAWLYIFFLLCFFFSPFAPAVVSSPSSGETHLLSTTRLRVFIRWLVCVF